MRKHDEDTSMQRLKQILASRYGKGLELRPLTTVADEDPFMGHELKGVDLHIPLRVRDAFLGTAVVPSAGDLTRENRLQISQMVRMVLEPTLYRDFLERREENMKSVGADEIDASNLRLFGEPEKPNLAPIVENTRIDAPKLVSNIVHLHGHDAQRIKRAALLLHEMAGRWAFAPLDDVRAGLESVDDLLKIGALTLFIDDVESLDPQMQKLLADYLSVPRPTDAPLLVTGSQRMPDELAARRTLVPELLDEVLVNALELDRAPLTEKGLRESLRLLFFEARED